MTKKTFVITHFYRSSPDNDGWIQTDFVVREISNPGTEYWLGFNEKRIAKNKLEEDIENGSLIRLPYPFQIRENETVWIAEDQTVYIADEYDPSQGDRTQIYKDNISDTYDLINMAIRKLIEDEAHQPSRAILEDSLNASQWKFLLDQILKYIHWGEITEGEIFDQFGYLFAAAQSAFDEEFTQYSNGSKFAIAYGSLCFETGDKKFVRWQIALNEDIDPSEIFAADFELDNSSVHSIMERVRSDKNHFFSTEI